MLEDKSAPPTESAKTFSILWFDDFPSNNAFLIEQFQNEGLDIQLALSTAEGMSKFQSGDFNLIITDLDRTEGGIDNRFAGLDLIKKVRTQNQNIPILVYTGRGGYLNRARLFIAGATKVFQSTVELVRIIQDIRNQVQKPT